MSNNKPERRKAQHEPFRPQQVLQWAMCHPGVLLLGSLAIGTLLAWRREIDHQTITDQQVETETDIIDGDVPLFI
jgi:septal ring-binding cell division protein DamX